MTTSTIESLAWVIRLLEEVPDMLRPGHLADVLPTPGRPSQPCEPKREGRQP